MKTDVKKLKIGDKLSMTTFMEVKSVGFGSIGVVDEDGKGLSIGDGVFESNIWSTQFSEEVKTPKTGIAEILMNAKDAIIQVCFDKADGSERVLTGYVIGAEVVLGRTIAIDIEKPKVIRKGKDDKEFDTRQRLVDHRTLKWLIYKNVKYFVK
jgi:hypothetical protein